MKFISSLIFALLTAGMAQASPYVVYLGSATGSTSSASGSTRTSDAVYLLTDMADTSNFAILQIDATDGVYTVISRPSDVPPAGEATDNFFGGILAANGKGGMGVLSYGTTTTDSSSNTYVATAYATGALTTSTSQLVAARAKPLAITLKTSGAVTGTYTFNPSTALSTGGNAYPKSLTGTYTNYEITSSGALAHVSTGGTISFSLNPTLTTLANIGGGYTSGKNTAAIMPVSVPGGTSEGDAFASWLSAFAQANGYSLPTINSPANVADGASLSLSGLLSDGSVTYAGSISFDEGTSLVRTGPGTIILGNGNLSWATGQVNLSGVLLESTSGGILSVGGSAPTSLWVLPTTTTTNYSGTTGATLSINSTNYNGGTLVLSGGQNGFTATGGGILTTGGTNPLSTGTIQFENAVTLTVTAVNGDSTLNGTIATTSITLDFTNVAFVNSNTTSVTVPSPQTGDVISCNASMKGGTFSDISGSPPSYAGGTLTITNVTADSNSASTSGP
jgi:hypothetical protein